MPTFVPATKYQAAHWIKRECEYRVTVYRRDDAGEWQGDCDRHKSRAAAIGAAKAYTAETGLPAVVERMDWTLGTFDAIDNGKPCGTPRPEAFNDWEHWGPRETLIYGEFPDFDD